MVCPYVTLLKILRVLGAFPYVWRNTAPPTRQALQKIGASMGWGLKKNASTERPDNFNYYIFRESKVWKVWSVTMCFFFTFILIWNFYDLTFFIQALGIETARVAFAIHEVSHSMTFMFCLLYCYWKKEILYEILKQVEELKVEIKKDRASIWGWSLMIVLCYSLFVIGTLVNVTICYFEPKLFRNSFHLARFFLFVSANNLLAVALIALLICILRINSQINKKTFRRFTNYSTWMDNSRTFSLLMSKNESFPAGIERPNEGLVLNSEDTISCYDLDFANESLLQLYSRLRLVNYYFSTIVVLLALHLIPTTILSLFHFTQLLPLKTLNILITLLNLVYTVGSLILLMNAPNELSQQRLEIRFDIVQVLNCQEMQQHRVKIYDLLQLYDDNKGFTCNGFFTLARARLVDIGSFVSTYFVILLQFRNAELASTVNCNKNI